MSRTPSLSLGNHFAGVSKMVLVSHHFADARKMVRSLGMSGGELILYTTNDGQARINLRALDGTVWLTQLQLAELFGVSVANVNVHIKNILWRMAN